MRIVGNRARNTDHRFFIFHPLSAGRVVERVLKMKRERSVFRALVGREYNMLESWAKKQRSVAYSTKHTVIEVHSLVTKDLGVFTME